MAPGLNPKHTIDAFSMVNSIVTAIDTVTRHFGFCQLSEDLSILLLLQNVLNAVLTYCSFFAGTKMHAYGVYLSLNWPKYYFTK